MWCAELYERIEGEEGVRNLSALFVIGRDP